MEGLKLKFDEMCCTKAIGLLGGPGLFWNKEVTIKVMEVRMNYIYTISCEKEGAFYGMRPLYMVILTLRREDFFRIEFKAFNWSMATHKCVLVILTNSSIVKKSMTSDHVAKGR